MDGPQEHLARLGPGELDRLGLIGGLDDHVAADLLDGLGEGPVGDQDLAALLADGGGGGRGGQLVAAPAGAVLGEQGLVGAPLGVDGLTFGGSGVGPGLLVAVDEQHVLHGVTSLPP